MTKRLVSLLLSLALILSACAAFAEGETRFVPGVYAGTGTGLNGELSVLVSVTADKITGIQLTGTSDTYYIYPVAYEKMTERILDAQSLAVDVVCGATRTSNGILKAVEMALTEAGADIEALKAPIEKSAVNETTDCDVLVVGAGLTGLAAANRLLENGADVLLIETMGYTGGAARFSGGAIRMANDEAYAQKAYDYLQTMMYYGNFPENEKYPNLDRVKEVCFKSIDVYDWQLRNGIILVDDLTDNDGAFTRRPAVPAEYTYMNVIRKGNFLTQEYEDAYLANGGRLLLETKAESLITDENGNVIGAKAKTLDGELTINAGAVILCTGSIGNDQELVKEYLPDYYGDLTELPKGTDGSGIRMALELGAVMTEDQYCNGGATHAYITDAYHVNGRYASRQDISTKSMFCSIDGERLCREDDDRYLRKYVVRDGLNQQFSVSDAALLTELGQIDKYEEEVAKNNNKGPYFKADSIEELAAVTGMNADTLKATVERYNSFCAKGVDEDYGKNAQLLNAIDEGPFYAVKTTFLGYDYVGGIETENDGSVIKADGSAIPGLYAAGFTSSREFLGTGSAHSYCLIICVSTGFISADSAMAYIGK